MPTFIVKVKGINLIVECQDFDADSSGNKDAKRHYLKDYWIPAANNLKTYGQWDQPHLYKSQLVAGVQIPLQ